ncbi:MAG TPA: hypothetical protein VF210_06295 [Pseudomonadales bacterium]
MNRTTILGALLAGWLCLPGTAEVIEYPGEAEPVAHERFVHVVSEAESPVLETYIPAKDGVYIAAAIRKPPGDGPHPALIVCNRPATTVLSQGGLISSMGVSSSMAFLTA